MKIEQLRKDFFNEEVTEDKVCFYNYLRVYGFKHAKINLEAFNKLYARFVDENANDTGESVDEAFSVSFLLSIMNEFSEKDFLNLNYSDKQKEELFREAFNMRNSEDFLKHIRKNLK